MSRISHNALGQAIAKVRVYVGNVKFGEDLGTSLRDQAMRRYVEKHPEKELLAFVEVETANWLQRIVPEEADKYIMLAAANLVNCIALVPMDARMLGALPSAADWSN